MTCAVTSIQADQGWKKNIPQSGLLQGCPPESCCPGTQATMPRVRAGCCFVRGEGSQGDVGTLLCSSNHSWCQESRQEQGQALEQGPSQPGKVMMSTHSTGTTLGQGKTNPCSLFPPFFIPTPILRPSPPPRRASRTYHTCKQEVCILKWPVPPR